MTKEYQAFQKLEQVIQTKKEVFQSCIQEWETVLQALEAVEAARQEDKRIEAEKRSKQTDSGKGLDAYSNHKFNRLFSKNGEPIKDGDPITAKSLMRYYNDMMQERSK